MRAWVFFLAVLLSGCIGYTSVKPPRHDTTVLPAGRPLWTGLDVEAPDHEALIASVVSATNVCVGEEGATQDDWRLRVRLAREERTSPVTEFLCGLTMTTFPAFQWSDLTLTGELVDREGKTRLAAVGQSTVGMAMSWVFAFVPPLLTDSAATSTTGEHVRMLTRYVVGELVSKYTRVRPAADGQQTPTVAIGGAQDDVGPAR